MVSGRLAQMTLAHAAALQRLDDQRPGVAWIDDVVDAEVGGGMQRAELLLEAAGYYGNPWQMAALDAGSNEPPVGPGFAKSAMPLYCRQRANTIEGGTEEIQKNVIAKQVLGL